jgi:hypothetical protein
MFPGPVALVDKAWNRANQPDADVRMLGFTVPSTLPFLFVCVAACLDGGPRGESA